MCLGYSTDFQIVKSCRLYMLIFAHICIFHFTSLTLGTTLDFQFLKIAVLAENKMCITIGHREVWNAVTLILRTACSTIGLAMTPVTWRSVERFLPKTAEMEA